MVYRVKIADKSHRSAEASHQQIRPAAFPDDDSLPAFNHRDRRDGDRDEIAEKRLLHRRKVARHADEERHQREEEARQYDKKDSLIFLFHLFHLFPVLLSVKYRNAAVSTLLCLSAGTLYRTPAGTGIQFDAFSYFRLILIKQILGNTD